jgi:pentatricopeptide repeat protein
MFVDLQNTEVKPDLYTYTSMITAYGNSEQWQKAEQMYFELQNKGFHPNLITYNALITAYGFNEQWLKAEQTSIELKQWLEARTDLM